MEQGKNARLAKFYLPDGSELIYAVEESFVTYENAILVDEIKYDYYGEGAQIRVCVKKGKTSKLFCNFPTQLII